MEVNKRIKDQDIIVDTSEMYDPVEDTWLDYNLELMPIKRSALAAMPVNKDITY